MTPEEEFKEKIYTAIDTRICPKCGSRLDCFFHERDSTSNTMDCTNKKCGWSAATDIHGEWNEW